MGLSDKKRPKISCITFIYYSFGAFIVLWQKICFYCGSKHTIKKGRQNGIQRWYCKSCSRYFIGGHRLTSKDVNEAFAKGNLTVSDLSDKFGVSSRTIHQYLSSTYKEALPAVIPCKVLVLMDATYWGRNFGVIIMSKRETIEDYLQGIHYLEAHRYEIQAIVCDGFKGLKEQLSRYKSSIASFIN